MSTGKKQSMLNGALVLVCATMLVKIIGLLYKIPLTNMITEVGMGYFSAAYELYTPILSISMAGIPVAVAKMVSQDVALHKYNNVRRLYDISFKLFMLVGAVGTLLVLIMAWPYSYYINGRQEAIYSVLSISPAVFFCCGMSIYRGYYEGLRNMFPTAISQVIEASGKLILGLVFSWIMMYYGKAQFEAGKAVFGVVVSNEAEALSAMYPFAAAGAILGVTCGTAFGMLFTILRHKIKGDGITRTDLVNSPPAEDAKVLQKQLIAFAVPVVLSSLILNLTNLIDAFTLRKCLVYVTEKHMDIIKSLYGASFTVSETLDKDIPMYLAGCYSTAINFKNLVPMITLNFGVSALPVLSAAWAVKNTKEVKVTIESVVRLTMLIALPAGIGMAVLAKPILTMLYPNLPGLIPISTPIMAMYGYATALMAVSTPITNMLQAVGRTDVPMRSMIIGAVVKVILNMILISNPYINIMGAPISSIVFYIIIVTLNLTALLKTTKSKLNWNSILVKPCFCAILCGVTAWAAFGLCSKGFSNVISADGLLGVSALNASNLSALVAIVGAVIVYAVALLLIKAIAKDDVVMLPKGEKIAKILEKYGLIG